MSPRGLSPLPFMPYSAALGESSHSLEVLLKKALSVVKYPAEHEISNSTQCPCGFSEGLHHTHTPVRVIGCW